MAKEKKEYIGAAGNKDEKIWLYIQQTYIVAITRWCQTKYPQAGSIGCICALFAEY